MPGHYDPLFVLLSLLISILASWAALDLTARIHIHRTASRRAVWLALGAFAMGTGIWSMHYVGMLAYRMPMPVLYDWPTVVLSLLAAVLASAEALWIVSRRSLSWSGTAIGSLFMGGGVASMHYIGMAAMRMPMSVVYAWPMVAVSILAAVVISFAGLRLTFGVRDVTSVWSKRKVGSALLMGCAIPTMHYLGMAAAHTIPGPGNYTPVALRHAVAVSTFSGFGIAFVTAFVILMALVSAGIDRYLLKSESDLERSQEQNLALNRRSHHLQSAFRASGIGFWECDPKTGLYYVDDCLRDMYNMPHDGQPVPRERWRANVHPDDMLRLDRRWQQCLASGDTYDNEYRVILLSGEARHYRSIANILRSKAGVIQRVAGMTWDVTAERRQEQEVAQQAERFRLTLEAVGDAVISTDEQQNITFLNRVASQLVGWSAEEALGKPLTEVLVTFDAETGVRCSSPVQRCWENNGTLLSEDGILVSRTGERYNISKYVALMPKSRAAVLTFQDITAARRLEKQLQYAASHDSLTALPNREVFERELRSLWQTTRHTADTHCLCIVDLDRFKIINDTSGHMAGDALLKKISQLLQASVRPSDIVARMGGDEFMILLVSNTAEQGEVCAKRLLENIAELRFPWHGKIYDITASIGLVAFDHTSPEPEVLLSQADVAAFTSKRNGRNQISIYSEAAGGAFSHHQEMEIVADLRRAIEENCFELHAQPIVLPEATTQPTYFELLVRMRNAAGDLISPALFIPAAERYGLMTMIDRWVIRHAFAQCAPHCGQGCDLRLAINLSADSLSDPTLWDFVQDQFLCTGVSPSAITFEITETGLIQNLAHARSFLSQAQKAGSRIALDDFGTGLASLSYLKQFPLDVLKIDGAFIKKLIANPLDQTIVSAIATIARGMKACTVAECVEDTQTITLLQTLGVSYIQGWATGRPVPFQTVLTGLQHRDDPGAVQPSHHPGFPLPALLSPTSSQNVHAVEVLPAAVLLAGTHSPLHDALR